MSKDATRQNLRAEKYRNKFDVHVPLSVRYGGPVKRFRWRLKLRQLKKSIARLENQGK
jgi:hypothetical protein